jgi:hypothetical protein
MPNPSFVATSLVLYWFYKQVPTFYKTKQEQALKIYISKKMISYLLGWGEEGGCLMFAGGIIIPHLWDKMDLNPLSHFQILSLSYIHYSPPCELSLNIHISVMHICATHIHKRNNQYCLF